MWHRYPACVALGQRILFQSDYLPLAPIISRNMKQCIKVWSCFLRPELKQWKFLGFKIGDLSAHRGIQV
jgi:hypothetical protein